MEINDVVDSASLLLLILLLLLLPGGLLLLLLLSFAEDFFEAADFGKEEVAGGATR